MRNRSLHDTLQAFTEEAAAQLEADAAGGAEMPFEVLEAPGSKATLYCYRPLTDDFIRQRIGALGRLPGYAPAARAVEGLGGLDAYLRFQGEPRIPAAPPERADAALRTMLSSVFSESSEFTFSSERFDRAFSELEAAVYESRSLATVVAPLLGLELESPEVSLGDGMALVRSDALSDAPVEAIGTGRREGEPPVVLVRLTVEGVPGDPAPVTDARSRFRRLLSALRLFENGGFALGPAAWTRIDAGSWQLVPLGGSGRRSGSRLVIEAEHEDELRAFCNLVARRAPASGALAWALSRFEMGCERLSPFEGLTDYLLALRSLLEPEGPGSGRLAQRLAALCALPEQRALLAERTAYAISLERAVVGGLGAAEPHADVLVDELAAHTRALLRDVLCGHLDADLVAVADEILEVAATAERASRRDADTADFAVVSEADTAEAPAVAGA